jgi:hypothetical protein
MAAMLRRMSGFFAIAYFTTLSLPPVQIIVTLIFLPLTPLLKMPLFSPPCSTPLLLRVDSPPFADIVIAR